MKKNPITNYIMLQLKNVKKIIDKNSSIYNEVIFQNINRIYYLSFIGVPVSVLISLIFSYNKSIITETDVRWRMGIISTHIFTVAYMCLITIITRYIMKKTRFMMNKLIMNLLITITITIILLLGVTTTTIDQLVTPNITPFIIACTITAAVFIMRPLYAVIVYGSAYGIYYYALAFTQYNDKMLLSNRVNGITAVGIGFGLSVVLWKYKVTSVKQRRYIEMQQLDLVESNQKLSELNKIKDRLFTIITHDV